MKLTKIAATGICFALALSAAACSADGRNREKDRDEDSTPWYASESTAEAETEASFPSLETSETENTIVVTDLSRETEPYAPDLPDAAITEISIRLTELNHAGYYLTDFESSEYDLKDVLHVARTCLKLADNGLPLYDSEYETYPVQEVKNFLMEYFGIDISDSDLASLSEPGGDFDLAREPFYDGEYLYFYAADGEIYSAIDIVRSYEPNGDGTYDIYFNRYQLDLEKAMDISWEEYYEYCGLTAGEADNNPDLTYVGTGEAEIAMTSAGPQFIEIDFNET